MAINVASAYQNARRIQARATCGQSTIASEPARARLFGLSPPCSPPSQFSKHHALRQSRVLHARHQSSCVKSSRCSHFSTSGGCPDKKSSGRCDRTFANRYSESGGRGGLGAACRSGPRAGSTWRGRISVSRVPPLVASGF